MTTISIVATSRGRLADLCAALSGDVAADYLRLEDLPDSKPNDTAILDIDLGQCSEVQAVKAWLSHRSQPGNVIVCVDDATSHLQLTQARALGATAVVPRPLQAAQLHRILFGVELSFAPSLQPAIDDPSQALTAIQDMFAAARMGRSPSMDVVTHAGAQIVDRIQDMGLSDYLSAIRHHHSRTYTHCLAVTAVAVSFGIQLGVGRKDRERLAVAGLLHDIGKSQISLDILEKPAALDERETLVMRTHPVLGHDMLRGTPGLPDDTLDMVLHHHEYLDGSGYPDGLQGSQISDLNRMMTIADVYGALIEPRSYRPPMEVLQALDVLRAMGPKLDAALVRVFAPMACRLAA
jgi:putative nucleotidyltransferase with HDIG domain